MVQVATSDDDSEAGTPSKIVTPVRKRVMDRHGLAPVPEPQQPADSPQPMDVEAPEDKPSAAEAKPTMLLPAPVRLQPYVFACWI